ncbi:hypothetical protein E3N88_15686 [Mikania micrantha]|uniref:BED-type domain-containing protein n=1 Tax=Mikania micrantha TaxID=192012 RepID=A0A5N6NYV9_9ASTR|nr:hypothetical protein E3N88_15686 [Mikania micrantha]
MSTKNARRDPAWKYGVEHQVPAQGGKKGYKYIKCNFCSKVITGGVKRMKEHLGCTHKDVAPCDTVPPEVKEEILHYLKQFQENKFASQRNFEESVGSGAYYSGDGSVNPSSSSRGVRGPMDRFMGSARDNEDGSLQNEKMTTASAKEHRNRIWDIIDKKWELQMHRDLHTAAYYLNPQYRWSPNVSEHAEIKRGLYNVMARFVKDTQVYTKIEDQLIAYKEKKGLFGFRVKWWGEYGDDTPELKAFAMKVLGLTCSASASTFNVANLSAFVPEDDDPLDLRTSLFEEGGMMWVTWKKAWIRVQVMWRCETGRGDVRRNPCRVAERGNEDEGRDPRDIAEIARLQQRIRDLELDREEREGETNTDFIFWDYGEGLGNPFGKRHQGTFESDPLPMNNRQKQLSLTSQNIPAHRSCAPWF